MSSPSEFVTERTFYPAIMELARQIGERVGIRVAKASEVRIREEFPDIILQLDGHDLLVQVKIDSIARMLDDLARTYPIAASRRAGLLLLLLSPEARRIHPFEVEKVAPKVHVRRALLLTSWASKHMEETELENVLRLALDILKEYEKVRKPLVDYMTVALTAREAIEELASVMRRCIVTTPRLLNQAQAIIGSFDFYRALLRDLVENEELMNTYIADIVAYISVLSLLFLHAVSIKRYRQSILPQISDPASPPQDLLDIMEEEVKASPLRADYRFIVEPFLYILDIFKDKDVAGLVRHTLAQYLYAIQVLRPEHVKEELFGRIYQEGLPPETRKNLGAFFTNPVAAKLLARLAVERWDEEVLDPACGSGTLLVSAYEAKLEGALAQGMGRREAHELFLQKHIVGIDVMQFAKELTSINLALQDVEAPVEPKVYWGDGIEKMMSALDDPPRQASMYEYFIERDRERYREHELAMEGLDLVIMNPPFTRRENIPKSERKKLSDLLGDIVRGKVGYWAYFFAAANNVVKPSGKLASVTPEEFFVGRSAESVRRFLLRGEVMRDGEWVKVSRRVYVPQVIVKSTIDVAFSEGAHYRDYLVVFRGKLEGELKDDDRCMVVILKKKLDELKDMEKDIAMQIRGSKGGASVIIGDPFDVIMLDKVSSLIQEFIDNMKPLVGFNTVKGFEFYQQLLNMESLKRLDEVARLRDYTAQYTGRGFEEYVRRLFIPRYETRAPLVSFEFVSEAAGSVKVRIKGKGKKETSFNIPNEGLVHSLRTYANVKSIDITGEEEYAIVDPSTVDKKYLKLSGLIDEEKLGKASEDIKKAYDEIAGHVLLVRRARLTSPNMYWLAFYSDNKIIGPSSPMICMRLEGESPEYYKALTLYLNSSITFLQLLACLAMAEGGWVTLHSDQVWSKVRVPDVTSLPRSVLEEALQTFNEVAKATANLQPLHLRYASKSELQRRIDKAALKMMGVNWDDMQLSALYDTIRSELDVMQRILEEAQKRRKIERRKGGEEEDEEEAGPEEKRLTEWMKE